VGAAVTAGFLKVGPTAVLISVGINVLLGGEVLLVKLLTAGQYISIISFSMQSLTGECVTNHQPFASEDHGFTISVPCHTR
jgi:hypothetical protein